MIDLEALRPTKKLLVMDLLVEAGMDVSDWANFKKGPSYASSNPKYCYEWSFLDNSRLILNLWHDNMLIENGIVVHRVNFREDALENRINNPNRGWGKRGLKIDGHIRAAKLKSLPIQVIVLAGKRRENNEVNAIASEVGFRCLDDEYWTISFYNDENGDCVLSRGKFVDQFSAEIWRQPDKIQRTGFVFTRSVVVRHIALTRASGKCEFCNQSGFIMSNGAIYLETHHIVPLCDGGADVSENVIALCPNHHREAHFGHQKEDMQKAFQEILSYT